MRKRIVTGLFIFFAIAIASASPAGNIEISNPSPGLGYSIGVNSEIFLVEKGNSNIEVVNENENNEKDYSRKFDEQSKVIILEEGPYNEVEKEIKITLIKKIDGEYTYYISNRGIKEKKEGSDNKK